MSEQYEIVLDTSQKMSVLGSYFSRYIVFPFLEQEGFVCFMMQRQNILAISPPEVFLTVVTLRGYHDMQIAKKLKWLAEKTPIKPALCFPDYTMDDDGTAYLYLDKPVFKKGLILYSPLINAKKRIAVLKDKGVVDHLYRRAAGKRGRFSITRKQQQEEEDLSTSGWRLFEEAST